jgi:hypothetical protein
VAVDEVPIPFTALVRRLTDDPEPGSLNPWHQTSSADRMFFR